MDNLTTFFVCLVIGSFLTEYGSSGGTKPRQDRLKDVINSTGLDICRRRCDTQSAEIERLQQGESRWSQQVSWFQHWYPEVCRAYDEQVSRGEALEEDLREIHAYSILAYQTACDLMKQNKLLAAKNVVSEEEWKCHKQEAREAMEKAKSMERRWREAKAEVVELLREKDGMEIQNRAFRSAIETLCEERVAMIKKIQEAQAPHLEKDQAWPDLAADKEEESEDRCSEVGIASPTDSHSPKQFRSLASELQECGDYEEEEEEEGQDFEY